MDIVEIGQSRSGVVYWQKLCVDGNPGLMMSVNIYDATFFKGQQDASLVAAERVLPVVLSLMPFRSMLDIGCGVGPWVASALKLGITDALGIDGSYVDHSLLLIPQDLFQSYDLAQSFDLRRKFDLLVCMEVAEHIDPRSADVLVDNLVRHGDAILFSAAIPGQGGMNHVNEQWPDYWRDKFANRGYRQLDVIRRRIWSDQQIPVCYRQNAYMLVSEAKLFLYPALLAEAEKPHPVAWIHPDLFAEALQRPLALRRILKGLPAALAATLWTRFSRALGRKK